jgi:hypothetical protein
LLDFIVDDNPIKHGLLSPGYHIPVLSAQALADRCPDYVVILPWRFSEHIIAKNRPYLDQGGHFITILPELIIS